MTIIDTLITSARADRHGIASIRLSNGAYIDCRISDSGQARISGCGHKMNSRAKVEAYLAHTGATAA